MIAKIVKQIYLKTADKTGLLSAVCEKIAGAGVNIDAICAYAMEGQANFLLLTSNNTKAISVLKPAYPEIKEEEAVLVELDNKIGAAKGLGDKLKSAGINLSYLYGTTGIGNSAKMVFKTDNIKKAVQVLS